MLLVSVAYAWDGSRTRMSPLRRFGVASLLVYWIHVELVYGVPSMFLHRRLTIAQAFLGYVLVCAAMYGLVILKERKWDARFGRAAASSGTPAS
jgi:hypothetical protein